MQPLNLDEVREYVGENIGTFHQKRLNTLSTLTLRTLLTKKNPYLFRAKNLTVASDLVRDVLEAFLSSSEEKLFGDFLEDLAIFIAIRTCNGHKSTAPGVDLEFINNDIHYVISIKSGPNWGNSQQQSKQEEHLKDAVKRLKQSSLTLNVQPVLGICYGRTKTSYLRGYLKVVGQNFWYLISEDEELYKRIIEPIGYQAKQYNEAFLEGKSGIINLFTQEFIQNFCDSNGTVDWMKLVEFNSGNMKRQTLGNSSNDTGEGT